MRSAFALSWKVQWIGSFPVSGTDPDTVSLRLDRFTPQLPPIPVQLSVSVIGVKVCANDDDKTTLLCHSLRKVSCVVGRTERCQVAYIAREPTGQTYRRLCHLFHTDAPHQVEEIESVLGNAFQAAAMTSRSIAPQQHNDQLVPQKPHQLRPQSKSIITPQRFINSGVMPPPGNRRYSSNRTSTILIDSNPASLQSHPTPLLITDTKGTRIGKTDTVASNVSSDTAKGSVMESKACLNGTTDRVTPLMATPVTTKQRPLCTSAALLNRLFGGHLSSKSRMNSELFSNKENAVDAASGIGKNEDSTKINPPLKRRRRPVSAVFSQAFQRLSSSTSIYNSNKRFSSVDPTILKQRPTSIIRPANSSELTETPRQPPPQQQPPSIPPRLNPANRQKQLDETPKRFSTRFNESTPNPAAQQLALHFDERLSEWIYPIDELLERQLEQVAYFCKNAPRSKILKALLAQPEGAFVLRFSESKKKCLALSVRVPFTHNPTGVSHYLIVRNERGFKINGFNKSFPSIPMLVTHHSVMPELLPCRLIFAHWDNTWKCDNANNYDYPPCDDYDDCELMDKRISKDLI